MAHTGSPSRARKPGYRADHGTRVQVLFVLSGPANATLTVSRGALPSQV
jgi:hypothetical protein